MTDAALFLLAAGFVAFFAAGWYLRNPVWPSVIVALVGAVVVYSALYILLLIFCYVAGCPSIARDNEQIKESD